MPRYDVPKLADFSGAIQANQSMANAFSNLGNQSQDYLKMEEQKKNNEWNRAFDTQKFDLETNKYNSGLQEKADAKSANVGTLKALYPTEYGNLSNTMGNNPNLLGNVDIGNVQSYNTNIAKAAKEKEDALYQAGRDKISDGFERDRISISRANANKPSELDRLMSVLAPKINLGGNGQTDNGNPQQPQQENDAYSFMKNMKYNNGLLENKPQSNNDVLYSKTETSFMDKAGREWKTNPTTGRTYLSKDKYLDEKEKEALSSMSTDLGSLKYLQDNHSDKYTGTNSTIAEVGANKLNPFYDAPEGYATYKQKLNSLSNLARNKLFGASLTDGEKKAFEDGYISLGDKDTNFTAKLNEISRISETAKNRVYNNLKTQWGEQTAKKYMIDNGLLSNDNNQSETSNTKKSWREWDTEGKK